LKGTLSSAIAGEIRPMDVIRPALPKASCNWATLMRWSHCPSRDPRRMA